MEDKIEQFFKEEYDRINVPRGLKRKILSGESSKIFIIAAVSASAFVVFLALTFVQFSPMFDSIIKGLTLP